MAVCAICQQYLGLFSDKHSLTDGMCCGSCWSKTGAYLEGKSSVSTADIFFGIERMEAIGIAGKKVGAFFEQKCKSLGFAANELRWRLLTNHESYHFGILNGVLFQIEWDHAYRERYDILHTINTKKDAEQLVAKDLIYKAIPIEKIQYFSKEGDVQYTTKISGGGGGGSSISGAVVGGLLAGEAGAIIGSRQKINPIKSTTETHSTARTVLKYFEGNTLIVLTFFGHEMYNYLLERIPEKDFASVQLQQRQPRDDGNNIKDRLKTLKELYVEGLITENEYNEKKRELVMNI